MKPNRSLFHAAFSLLLSAVLSLCVQAQPAYTELSSPQAIRGGFGWTFGGLPDLTQDGVGEFQVRDRGRIYVFDGASLDQLYGIDDTEDCDFDFTTRTADSAGDLNGDGVPELMFGQECQGRVIMVDGKTGKELFRLRSPDSAGFFGHTVRLLPDMTGDGKEDWLIHARQGGFASGQSGASLGRVYIFDSQTRAVVRTLRNTETEYNFTMEFVDVIPDVDGDGKPELLTTARLASVRRGEQTYTRAGRALVRSLGTGKVLYELLDPEPSTGGRFSGFAHSAIGDINGDSIGDIGIGAPNNSAGVLYLFSGADGSWLRTIHSPTSQAGGFFGGNIEAMGDLNGDGVPELWINESFVFLTHIYDGRTSKLLKTIEYPGLDPLFGIATVRQEGLPGIRALVLAAPGEANYEGRVYFMPFTPLPKPPQLKPLGASNTGFRLQVIGDSGTKAEVQGTADFKSWEPVGSVTLGNEAAEVEDSTATSYAQRFYRAVQSP